MKLPTTLLALTLLTTTTVASPYYGNLVVTFFKTTTHCTGASQTLTINTPPRPAPNGPSPAYGKCVRISPQYNSFKILNTTEKIRDECGIVYYANEGCSGSTYETGVTQKGVCQDATVHSVTGDLSSLAFQIYCERGD